MPNSADVEAGDWWHTTIEPLVSVLCLAYNHELFLAQALDSFLMQRTSFNFEIVVGEDYSQDGTASILAAYAQRFPGKIRPLWAEQNLGMVANMRRTQAACRGKYIAICEGDDYWTDPEKLQKQVDFLQSNPEYVLSFHDALVLVNGVIEPMPQLPGRFRRDASAMELLTGRPLSTLTVCYRNVMKTIPADFDRVPMLDLCLWSLLGEHGKGKFMPNIEASIYRVHSGGAVSTKTQDAKYRMTLMTYAALSEYWRRRGNTEVARRLMNQAVLMGIKQLTMVSKIRAVIHNAIFFRSN